MNLFKAILDVPEDIEARLQYSKWLQDSRQSDRAELIRTQLRMTELERVLNQDDPEDPSSQEWDRLAERVHELMDAHPEWRSELPELPGIEWGAGQFWGFDGGFVSSVVVRDGATFVAQMESVFAVAPVTIVKLDYPDDRTVQAIADSPHLARLRSLRLSAGGCGDVGAAALAASPHCANLRVLSIFMCQIGPAGADSLARSPHFRADLTLQFFGNPVRPDDVDRLRQRFGYRLEV